MDSLDRDVLLALQADGRKSNLALARSLDLSPSAMLGRVRRLERSGAIVGYRAIIDPAVLGITVRAFVVARLREHSERSIICLLYTSPSPRDRQKSRMPSSA